MNYIQPGEYSTIKFSIAGNNENLEESCKEITSSIVYQNGLPFNDGVYSSKLGITENELRCTLCLNSKMFCPGHTGHISLNYPVQNHIYKDNIIQWLKVICFECGKCLINKLNLLDNIPDIKKLSEYVKLTRNAEKNIKCVHCGAIHPHIYRDKNRPVVIWQEFYNENKTETIQLFNNMIANIFERISNDTVKKLGKSDTSHPRKLILNYISVPPNNIRPDIKKPGGGRSNNDDLTTMLKAIIDINKTLPLIIPDNISPDIEANYTNIDMTYFEFVKGTPASSGKNKIVTNNNKPPGSLSSRIKGKRGRVRRNLMGSRTWYLARSVITCDPNIRTEELGVPKNIAVKLQIPETVNSRNRDRLLVYFNNKRDVYPGCTKVIKKSTGSEHWVGSLNRNFILEDGDIIMRDLIDGDPVVFNRQPSMLPECMTCHTIKIIDQGNTIRMNISACVLYNADFDGDTMNMLCSLSLITRNEISTLINVGENFMSRSKGGPLPGCFQDALASIAMLTHSDVKISKYNSMKLFKNTIYDVDKKQYTGRELISKILPPINLNATAFFYKKAYAPYFKFNNEDINVIIKRGELIQGILDYNTCGQQRNNSIFHIIHNELGSKTALDVLHDIQQVVMEYIYNRGFTIAMDDIEISEKSLYEIKEKTIALITEANRITKQLKEGKIIPPIGVEVHDFYEQLQLNALALGDDFVEPILSNIKPNNGMIQLIRMCKKGKMKNFQSITSALGSSMIEGKRADELFGYGRTLPYFTRFENSPESKGFVKESIISGFSLTSYLFQAQEARHAVIKCALSTSIGGHQGREGIKNTESIIINNNRICSKHKQIVQFVYGGNSIDTRKTEKVKIPTVLLSNLELEKKYHSKINLFESKFRNKQVQNLLDEEFKQLVKDISLYREIFLNTELVYANMPLSNKIQSPINIDRIIKNILYKYKDRKSEEIDPVSSINKINTLCKEFPYIYVNNIQKRRKSTIPIRYKYATDIICIFIRSYLNTRTLLRLNIDVKLLDIIIDEIILTMSKSLMDYGSAIGVLAAQSISEPMTQFFIDSHHYAGVSGGVADSRTDKLTRIQEVLHVKDTDAMQNPSMTLRVIEKYEADKIKVNEIANFIESMNFKLFVDSLQIFFEEYKNIQHPNYISDMKIINAYEQHNPNVKIPSDLTKWVIRFTVSVRSMILKNMDIETIIFAMIDKHPYLFIVYGYESDDTIIIRCYVRNISFKKNQKVTQLNIETIKNNILNTHIRGVYGVIATDIIKSKRSYICDDGSIKNKPIYIIKTNGTNLINIFENNNIDKDTLQSDSIKEIEMIYGIEAARYKLCAEIKNLIPGVYHSHYTIYADEMTRTGTVTGINKSGIQKREYNNTLLRTSHSFMNQILRDASINGIEEDLYGISAPLMLGRIPRVGSTYNNIAVDYDFISKNVEDVEDIIDDL